MVLLVSCVLFFVLSSMFGHDDGGGDVSDDGGLTHGDNGPSLLSLRNLLLFGIGFGAAGAVATHMGYSLIASSLAGFVFGMTVALAGWWFYRAIGRQQGSTNTDTRNLIGKPALVTTHIPPGRMGQVAAQDEYGGRVYLDARSNEGVEINEGEPVIITEAFGNTVTVAKPVHQY